MGLTITFEAKYHVCYATSNVIIEDSNAVCQCGLRPPTRFRMWVTRSRESHGCRKIPACMDLLKRWVSTGTRTLTNYELEFGMQEDSQTSICFTKASMMLMGINLSSKVSHGVTLLQ